ncbi:MAG: carboxylating nicotinate-nucleotide diphosphorylase [Pseudomonadota bacterium]
MPHLPPPDCIRHDVQRALDEDIGSGDITAALIPAEQASVARVYCREPAILCGQAWFDEVFRQLDARVRIRWHAQDGDPVARDQVLCELTGPSRAILSGERSALNFLQTLSGTATRTRRYVDLIAGTRAAILDTRKTLPGLRLAQKYAVACGGGKNHRIGLYDAILIKENHIMAAGSITSAVRQARSLHPAKPLEVEVETLQELEEALACQAPAILLDNMPLAMLRQAVAITRGRATLEASGGVSEETVRAIAETGVDYISIGGLTKDVKAVDLSMRFSV